MRLCELAPSAEKTAFASLEIANIVADTREAGAGSIFVARRGFSVDSHELVREAYERGTRVFLCEREVSLPGDALVVYAENTVKSAAGLLSRLYGEPQKRLKLVGVTGTKGKSTVSMMLSHILNTHGIQSISVGTLGVSGMEYSRRSENTTPDAFYLYPLLAAAVSAGKRVAVIEASSQALKTDRLYGLQFSCAILTSVGIDHIGEGEHEDFFDYLLAKRRLFTDFSAPIAVVNRDCRYHRTMTRGVKNCVGCSISEPIGIYAEGIVQEDGKTRFSVRGEEYSVKMAGGFNVMNSLLAAAAAESAFQVDLSSALASLSDLRVEGRFETFTHLGRLFVIDYAHNAMSISAVCRAVRKMRAGRLIVVVGSVGGRSRERRAEIAAAAEENADFTVITEDNPNYEPPISICADIYSAFQDKNRARIVTDREQAIRYAFSVSKENDAVLLLGKGHERAQRIRGENIPLNERTVVYSLDKGALV